MLLPNPRQPLAAVSVYGGRHKINHFEMAEKLEQFIEKKMNRFERHLNGDDKVDIRMSVIKPQTNANKEVKIRIAGLFAEKTADSFEEALDACLNALESQLERRKNA